MWELIANIAAWTNALAHLAALLVGVAWACGRQLETAGRLAWLRAPLGALLAGSGLGGLLRILGLF